MSNRAAIFGVSGVAGRAIAEQLLAEGWDVTGVSRHRPPGLPSLTYRSLDLLDADSTLAALTGNAITHVFYCAWIEPKVSADKPRLNADMIRHALEAAAAGGVLRHAGLVTGLSHYMGGDNEAPFTEDMPRGTGNPFYRRWKRCCWRQPRSTGSRGPWRDPVLSSATRRAMR